MCAIHQPNLFPRLSTLAKLYAADRWIVLDDVQFARRDYQHRARLASLDNPCDRQWLTLATHLPRGRPTLIREARLAEPERCRRRVAQLVRQHYGRSRHWQTVQTALDGVLDRFRTTDYTADIAEASTRALLTSLGWRGEVLRSSDLPAREKRSERLADIAAVTGSSVYLCGTGGLRYLETEPFATQGVTVVPFRTPAASHGIWQSVREVSGLWALATIGACTLAEELRAAASHALGRAILPPLPVLLDELHPNIVGLDAP
ncbi:WbqC family protein [Streptomyces lunaelactis]|uniref:WbqC family protein n=1 Tax=Streptomyces lunaelactis TaxID=1535768 RepID=UPI0015848D2C|nr:WbqC family protein [Streptomyces lunaelactis]NUK35060.1 WbqC family protein [Streptomyces lunaelactis]NUK44667.1 WbqC family protein [Streptomyces lunaelactis]NUK92133.1 WbqC family protein [Streptomyces lunaelactis]NUL29890.1 WbqC family protein [Streptomyces lunaelactis]